MALPIVSPLGNVASWPSSFPDGSTRSGSMSGIVTGCEGITIVLTVDGCVAEGGAARRESARRARGVVSTFLAALTFMMAFFS